VRVPHTNVAIWVRRNTEVKIPIPTSHDEGLAGFKETGKRMLAAWSEGVSVLRDSRMYGLSMWKSSPAFERISDPPKLENPRTVIGHSELLSHRAKSKS
jgi:hypothetical protein